MGARNVQELGIYQEVRRLSKTTGVMSERHGNQFEGIKRNCNLLKYIKYLKRYEYIITQIKPPKLPLS